MREVECGESMQVSYQSTHKDSAQIGKPSHTAAAHINSALELSP